MGGSSNWKVKRRHSLKKFFGLTLEDYDQMLEAQGGVCAICLQRETFTIKGKVIFLAVDHCHSTGVIRALLCRSCNTTLGRFRDDPAVIQTAIEYLISARESSLE